MFGGRLANVLHLNSKTKIWTKCPGVVTYICTAHKTTTTNVETAKNDFLLQQVHIDEAVRISPTLSAIPADLWRRSHETFANHGFNTSNFLRIITGNPTVLTRSPHKIIESIENWRSCQFGENLMFLLITKYPELLDVTDRRRILTHVTFLKGLVSTNKYVWLLLMNAPKLLEQTEPCIEEKMDYLQHVMHIEVPEVVKCGALSQPIDDIRCRHMFLMRLGLFTPRSPKAAEHEPSKNPRLHRIMDTSEKTFATKVCHVTLAEFEAFKQLYARERAKDERDEQDLLNDDK